MSSEGEASVVLYGWMNQKNESELEAAGEPFPLVHPGSEIVRFFDGFDEISFMGPSDVERSPDFPVLRRFLESDGRVRICEGSLGFSFEGMSLKEAHDLHAELLCGDKRRTMLSMVVGKPVETVESIVVERQSDFVEEAENGFLFVVRAKMTEQLGRSTAKHALNFAKGQLNSIDMMAPIVCLFLNEGEVVLPDSLSMLSAEVVALDCSDLDVNADGTIRALNDIFILVSRTHAGLRALKEALRRVFPGTDQPIPDRLVDDDDRMRLEQVLRLVGFSDKGASEMTRSVQSMGSEIDTQMALLSKLQDVCRAVDSKESLRSVLDELGADVSHHAWVDVMHRKFDEEHDAFNILLPRLLRALYRPLVEDLEPNRPTPYHMMSREITLLKCRPTFSESNGPGAAGGGSMPPSICLPETHVRVYHGTTSSSAENILRGVQVFSFSHDFGPRFYTTPFWDIAYQHACKKTKRYGPIGDVPAVVAFDIPKQNFSDLCADSTSCFRFGTDGKSLSPVEIVEKDRWERFVSMCLAPEDEKPFQRSPEDSNPMLIGPILENPQDIGTTTSLRPITFPRSDQQIAFSQTIASRLTYKLSTIFFYPQTN